MKFHSSAGRGMVGFGPEGSWLGSGGGCFHPTPLGDSRIRLSGGVKRLWPLCKSLFPNLLCVRSSRSQPCRIRTLAAISISEDMQAEDNGWNSKAPDGVLEPYGTWNVVAVEYIT